MKAKIQEKSPGKVYCKHDTLEEFLCFFESSQKGKDADLLFTENETNSEVFIMITSSDNTLTSL